MKPLQRARLLRVVPVVVAWAACFLPLFRARNDLVVAPDAMVWVALATFVSMLAAVAYVVRYRVPRIVRQDFLRWIAVGAAPIFAISAAAGGLAPTPR